MNNRGQMNTMVGIGAIIIIAIIAIVGSIFTVSIAQESGRSLDTTTLSAFDLGTQNNGTVYYFTDYRAIGGTIQVAGNGSVAPVALSSGNYTITNNVIHPTTGALCASLLPASEYTGTNWDINATEVQPLTYVGDTGSRAMIGLILIFFALGIAIAVLVKSGVIQQLKDYL